MIVGVMRYKNIGSFLFFNKKNKKSKKRKNEEKQKNEKKSVFRILKNKRS